MGLFVLMLIKSGGFREIDPLYMTETGISVAEPLAYINFYFVIALFLVLALAAGKRGFCHYSCWMAPFMIIGRKIRNAFGWPSLRLRAIQDRCIECKRCTRECPMSLDVQQMVLKGHMEHAECILCGTCIDTCPKEAIRYTFSGG